MARARICVDHGLTGTNRARPGLREALAACRARDTLVVTKLDRLARSLHDARAIAEELTLRQASLNLGGSVYDPTDSIGRLLFNVLAMVAEFESDLIRIPKRTEICTTQIVGGLRLRRTLVRTNGHLVQLMPCRIGPWGMGGNQDTDRSDSLAPPGLDPVIPFHP